LTVPSTPSRLWLFAGLRFVPLPLERDEPLLEREALARARVDADDFERDAPSEERVEPLREAPLDEPEDPLAFVFEPEPLDDLLLRCPLREADLLLAILFSLFVENLLRLGYPLYSANNRYLPGFPKSSTARP